MSTLKMALLSTMLLAVHIKFHRTPKKPSQATCIVGVSALSVYYNVGAPRADAGETLLVSFVMSLMGLMVC